MSVSASSTSSHTGEQRSRSASSGRGTSIQSTSRPSSISSRTSVASSRRAHSPFNRPEDQIKRVLVVVPVHNEQQNLKLCLNSIRRAASKIAPVPVHIVVSADRCTDHSIPIARTARAQVHVASSKAQGVVGAVRDEGVQAGLAETGWPADAHTWLASTDADCVVPQGWLALQLKWINYGYNVFYGRVVVAGRDRYVKLYLKLAAEGIDGHWNWNTWDCNFGVRISLYQAAGGFPHDPHVDETATLFHRLKSQCKARVCRPSADPVKTSKRVRSRLTGDLAITFADQLKYVKDVTARGLPIDHDVFYGMDLKKLRMYAEGE